jgi:NACHT domain
MVERYQRWVGPVLAVLSLLLGAFLYIWVGSSLAERLSLLAVPPAIAGLWPLFSLRPTMATLDKHADDLALEVAERWDEYLSNLVEGQRADLRFSRVDGSGPDGSLREADSFYRSLDPSGSDDMVGRLVILGAPGSGKTVLAGELVLQLLRAREDEPIAKRRRVPLALDVGSWDTRLSLRDWVVEHLRESYKLSRAIARGLVDRNHILLVLDGLDQLGVAGIGDVRRVRSSPKSVVAALKELNKLKNGRPLPMVVTCQRDYYRHLSSRGLVLREQTAVIIHGLEAKQVSEYLAQIFPGASILKFVEEHENGPLATVLATPWVLTLAVTACKASPMTEITTKRLCGYTDVSSLREDLIDQFIPAVTSLDPDERYELVRVRAWLVTLARYLGRQRTRGLSGSDLIPHKLWMIAGTRRTRLLHTLLSVPAGLVVAGFSGEFIGGLSGLVIVAITGVTGAGFGLYAGLKRDPHPSRVDFRDLLPRREKRRLPWHEARLTWRGGLRLALVVGLAILGGVLGTIDVLGVDPHGNKAIDTAAGITSGLASGLATAILAGLGRGVAHAVRPSDALRADVWFGLVLGMAAGLAAGLPGGLTGGLLTALRLNARITVPGSIALALALGIASGVALGSRAWLRYAVALCLLAPRGSVPWRLTGFMDWASDVGLLRLSGTAYQFRHEELKDWLSRDHGQRRAVSAELTADPCTGR